MLANGFPDSWSRSSLAAVDEAGAMAGAAEPPAGAATPNRSRMLGVSSEDGAGAAANGLDAPAVERNFSMAASSSCMSWAAVFSSMFPPPLFAALPNALQNISQLCMHWKI